MPQGSIHTKCRQHMYIDAYTCTQILIQYNLLDVVVTHKAAIVPLPLTIHPQPLVESQALWVTVEPRCSKSLKSSHLTNVYWIPWSMAGIGRFHCIALDKANMYNTYIHVSTYNLCPRGLRNELWLAADPAGD